MIRKKSAWSKTLLAQVRRVRELFRMLRKNPLALTGIVIVSGILIIAVLAPILAPPNPIDPYQRPRTWRLPEPPGTPDHILGTGVNGADIYYGVIWGTRVSLGLAVLVVSASALIGVLLGGIAGYFGKWVDEIIMRISDLFISIPGLIMAMAVASALGRSLMNIMIALVIIWWPWYVRIFRSQVLTTKQEQYIDAARCSGASQGRIIFKHIVPNSLTPVVVQASLDLGVTLLIAAGLSFIGFGAEPGFSEWGLMIAEGRDYIAQGFWWMVFFPGLAISIFVLGFNLLGDGLRDMFDPRLRSLLYESVGLGKAERRRIRQQAYERAIQREIIYDESTRIDRTSPLLRVEALTLRFPTMWGEAKVLEDVTFEVHRGETFGLVGESGCGKSVTAKAIIGLIDCPPARIVRGRILYFPLADKTKPLRGVNLLALDESELVRIRGCAISMISQDPMTSLNPLLTAGYQVAESLLIHQRPELLRAVLTRIRVTIELIGRGEQLMKRSSGVGYVCSCCGGLVTTIAASCPRCNAYFMDSISKLVFKLRMLLLQRIGRGGIAGDSMFARFSRHVPLFNYERLLKDEAMARAVELIDAVRIPDAEKVAESYPYELSGGMQQRISIAMALACRPSILIADEPTTALDVTIQAQILKLISELKERFDMSVLLITHNLGIIAEQCDRVAVMYAGSIDEIGDVRSIFRKPMHPYTKGLMRCIPVIGESKEELAVIPGRVPDMKDPPSGCRFRTRCGFAFDKCAKVVPRPIMTEPGHWVSCHLYE